MWQLYAIYFPVISIVLRFDASIEVSHVPRSQESRQVADNSAVARLPSDQGTELAAVFLHVVKSVSPEHLRFWWKEKLVARDRIRLMDLFRWCTTFTAYPNASHLVGYDRSAEPKLENWRDALPERNASISSRRGGVTTGSFASSYAAGGIGSAKARLEARKRTSHASGNDNSGLQSRGHTFSGGSVENFKSASEGRDLPSSPHGHRGDSNQTNSQSSGSPNHVGGKTPVRSSAALQRLREVQQPGDASSSDCGGGGGTGGNTASTEKRNLSQYSSCEHLGPTFDPTVIVLQRQALATESALTVLDVLDFFFEDFCSDLSDAERGSELMDHTFGVIVALLESDQSRETIQHIFCMLQMFVRTFNKIVFRATHPAIVAKLCERTLKYCASSVKETRERGSAFLYLLMRMNFNNTAKETENSSGQVGGQVANFFLMREQATIALSQIVEDLPTDIYVRKSLATILSYTKNDKSMRTSKFPGGVEDMVLTLHSVLHDTQMIQAAVEDEDDATVIDLHYQIAKSYTGSPGLRLTWLMKIKKKHEQKDRYAEAAFAAVHCAALMAEYLDGDENYPSLSLPSGCKAFDILSKNIQKDEGHRRCGSGSGNVADGSAGFSPEKLIGLMKSAVESFLKAHMHEYANMIRSKLLAPYYEAQRSVEAVYALRDLHLAISQSYGKQESSDAPLGIIELDRGQKRFFGTYFRVGYYCCGMELPERIRNMQFVQKEPGVSSLSTVAPRLRAQVARGLENGEAAVEFLSDIDVGENKKDMVAGKVYLHVTRLEPLFEGSDSRKNFFDCNTNLKAFTFSCPFTDSGKAHGDITEQKMRVTTLRVDRSFPYVKTRLQVMAGPSGVEHKELSPIEVSTDSIQQKIYALERFRTTLPIDVKMLQLQLQGSVSVSVNDGPGLIAQKFLGKDAPTPSDKSGEKLVKRLKQTFGRFIDECELSLQV